MGRVAVLNDFEANGYGILALKPEDVIVLHDAQPQPKVRSSASSSCCQFADPFTQLATLLLPIPAGASGSKQVAS